MSKKSWIKLEYKSSMDRPVTDLFKGSHQCDKRGEVYISNAFLGQHTGQNYRLIEDVTEIKFECLRCRSRFIALVNGHGRDEIPPFPQWAFEKARDAMFEHGCKHSGSWMMTPVVLDGDDHRIRIVDCSSCRMRVRIDW